ncbi:MAG TPA: hypothetical protein VEX38_04380 [Fimbriimonadaceae bacterium]|nr:hypothetical protein [Fimbriimonadaceae bacterium]
MSTGYSGTPLAKKLGIKPGQTVYVLAGPQGFEELLQPLPAGADINRSEPPSGAEMIHLFVTWRAELLGAAEMILDRLAKDGVLWISWPKKGSKQPTDITEDTLREVLLPSGLVDVKVCAVDETWSGLKFVWRKELR